MAYLEINRKTKCVDQFELRLIFLCLKDKLERKLVSISTILMLFLLAGFAPSPSVFSLCTHSESLILLRF